MNLERLTYRYELIDGTARAGSLEFKGRRFPLPVILDPMDLEGRYRIISVHGGWEDVGVRLVGDRSPEEVPEPLRRAMQDTLKGMGTSSFYPVVSTTRSRLIGSIEDKEAEMPVHVLPHFNITALDPTRVLRAMLGHTISDPAHDPVFIPGIVDHGNLELLLLFGLEIFDTIKIRSDGLSGLYHTDLGPIPFERLDRMGGVKALCNCPHCQYLAGSHSKEDTARSIIGHNIEMMSRRLILGISAMKEGRLREVVMGRIAGNPSWMSALRTVERSPDPAFFELLPTYRKKEQTFVTYRDDLIHPDFTAWKKRIIEGYSPIPGRKILLLLPCSARKPYSTSRTHQRIRDSLKGVKGWKGQVQQVVITSPLGAVPMELEDLYPASYYDIPVTGEWYPEEIEAAREVAASIHSKGAYEQVICFHREGDIFFPDEVATEVFGGAAFLDVHSKADKEGSDPFRLLADTISDILQPVKGINYEKEDLFSLVRYSLSADISGIPDLKVKWSRRGREMRKGKEPLIIFKKGGPVPTVSGGKFLWDLPEDTGGKKVFIDDFRPKGTVFSQGILSTSGTIRPGDIVLVGTEKEYRGVGRAIVPGNILTREVHGPGIRMIHTSG